MTKEDLILEKLEKIESQIEPIMKTAGALNELKNDLIPIGNHATGLLIQELTEIEPGFQMEDFLSLIKETMRNTHNFIFALKQMASVIEFLKDIEPLLKSAVPQMIKYLNELEQQGIFRILKATLDMRAKVAASYSPEDIDKVGDGLVALLGLAKIISDPEAIRFLQKFAEIPGKVDLSKAKKMGPFKLAFAGFDNEVGQGLGVIMELTKAMGKLKVNEQNA
jgi:uncharacterized protein YjgD (DUF1641 family)